MTRREKKKDPLLLERQGRIGDYGREFLRSNIINSRVSTYVATIINK